MKKKISIAFLGNIFYDTRSYNLYVSLKSRKHKIIFNGFDWTGSDFKPVRSSNVNIEKLKKGRISLIFYLRFAAVLFFNLMKQRSDIYFASDFYCLPICLAVAKLKGAKIFYDCREIYPELNGIQNKKWIKGLIKAVEGFCARKVDIIFTTGEMDSDYIQDLYKIERPLLLRNLPILKKDIKKIDLRTRYNISTGKSILLYQGIIMPGRGIEAVFSMLSEWEDCVFLILGWGRYQDYYEKLAEKMGVKNRVIFAGKISQKKLLEYTAGCDVGLCLIEDTSISYHYAFPNKLFEYIMAGIPVIVSDLPQMKIIIKEFGIGDVLSKNNSNELLIVIKKWRTDSVLYDRLKENCRKASKMLNWEKEFKKIYKYFK